MTKLKQTYGAKFDSKRIYLTVPEMQLFKEMRESCEITFFQVGVCDYCGGEVPRSKQYCSKRCMEVDHGISREMD